MNKKGELRDSNIIIDMNDIKGVFREWMMKKMDEDFEGSHMLTARNTPTY